MTASRDGAMQIDPEKTTVAQYFSGKTYNTGILSLYA